MTQDEFNALANEYYAQYLNTGYYTSRYSGEEIDNMLEGRQLVITGVYDNLAALQKAHPNGTTGLFQAADTRDLYVWDAGSKSWKSLGQIQGPRGEQGPQGPKGDKGDQGVKGDVMYATFWVDANTGDLYMYTDPAYAGASFRLSGADLEVVI